MGRCIPAYVIGIVRGISVVIGIAATVVYPMLQHHISTIRTGLWSIWSKNLVPESDCLIVGGVHSSLQSFMDLLAFVMGIIISDPRVSSGAALAGNMPGGHVSNRSVPRPMNVGMQKMHQLQAYNLTSQAGMGSGINLSSIPMQRVEEERPNGNARIPSTAEIKTYVRLLSIKRSRTNTRGRRLVRIHQEKQQCEHERLHNSIQDRGINKVYIIGGDGTQRAASVNFLII
ncbi:iron regulated [Trifolium repens]|nr:iron regulated [Trifolium repens]